MSHCGCRGDPRSSTVRGGLPSWEGSVHVPPVPRARLAVDGASVRPGPPLLVSGPSWGSTPTRSVGGVSPHWEGVVDSRLWPPSVNWPPKSAQLPFVVLPIPLVKIVSETRTGPASSRLPPPVWLPAEGCTAFVAKVSLASTTPAPPACTDMPPPNPLPGAEPTFDVPAPPVAVSWATVTSTNELVAAA